MTYTKEQLRILASWEENFRTAIQSKWSRGIGTTGYTTIHRIYTEATGKKLPFHPSCGTCMLHLLQDAGKVYFEDMKALAEEEKKAHEVAVKETAETETQKVEVKTTKARKPRTKKTAE